MSIFHQNLLKWLRKAIKRHRTDDILITDEQWSTCEARLPFLGRLDDDERYRLRELAVAFLAEKQMHGAQGLELHADMQISIALQACLPILNLGLDWYLGWVGIVVYPGDFVIPREIMDEDGIVHKFDDAVIGEAWQDGPVLLSWFDGDDEEVAAGVNVVIHEFAHKLDMKNGLADGVPPLHAGMSHQDWQQSFTDAYADFCMRVDDSEDTPLDPYGADSPAEFFAVMSEAFFETPRLLKEEYPAIFDQLQLFYRQNPLPPRSPDKPQNG